MSVPLPVYTRYRSNRSVWHQLCQPAISFDEKLDGNITRSWINQAWGYEVPNSLNDLRIDRYIIADSKNSRRKTGFRAGHRPVSACFHWNTHFGYEGESNPNFVPNMRISDTHFSSGWTPPYRWSLAFRSGARPLVPLVRLGGVLGDWDETHQVLPSGGNSAMPVAPNSVIDDYRREAFNYFSNVFPQSLSFSEFLQGIFELKALLPSIQDSMTKTLSGGYLNEKFGWENLVSDLKTLGNLFSIVTDRMDWFHRTYGVPTRLGFSRKGIWSPNLASYNWTDNENFAGPRGDRLRTRTTMLSYQADFRATCWILQTLDFVDGLVGFIRTMTGALGLNNPVKAFWNVLPFSFVVDWFLDVSSHLDNLTRLNPPVGWNILDVSSSMTYKSVYEVVQLPDSDGVLDNTPTRYLITTDIYDRRVGLSWDLGLLDPNTLSPNQLTLLLAMLHQLS